MDAFTKRNHYNPCFWTALWNPTYFEAWRKGDSPVGSARDQVVSTLNLRAQRVYQTKVESVHFEKDLGVAEITPDSMKSFCRRRYPSEYPNLAAYVADHPETLYLDFEDILEGMEHLGVYDSLLEAARLGGLSSVMHKGLLTCVLIIHAMRSHELMTNMIETMSFMGMEKWEYFWLLKNVWANQLILARAVTPLAFTQWTLYATRESRFPLPDSPVMIGRDSLMAVLSPRLLVEINLNVGRPEDDWTVREEISSSKYWEFRRRAIGNAFKDIIFHDPTLLETWRDLPECRQRMTALANARSRASLVNAAASRIIWAMDGFGRVPRDFEARVGKYLDA